MYREAAGKSSGIITSDIELGGSFFPLSLISSAEPKQEIFFLAFPIFISEGDLSFSTVIFFQYSNMLATDLIFPFSPPQSLGEKKYETN